MLITSTSAILLSNAVSLRRDKTILYSRIAILLLLFSIYIAYDSLYLAPLKKGFGLFGGLFQISPTTQIFHIFIFMVSAAIIQLTAFYPRKVWIRQYSSPFKLIFSLFNFYRTKIINKMAEQYRILEYPLIILFIIIGTVFLVSTSDVVSIFLSIELQSYGLYLLSTLYRNSELATSAGLTYFLLGGLASCFILLATALLYANSGTTNLDGLYIITSLSDLTNYPLANAENITSWYKPFYIHLSFMIMSVGFLFKVSAAPFHFWSPDVYDSIPTIVTTFVAIIAKISILIFFLELVHYTTNSFFSQQFTWKNSLLLSSFLSLIIGTILGLTQFRIKRLYAYSTISHIGFLLLALSINSIESTQAFIFYLMQYSLSNLNAFFILVTIGFSLYFLIYNNKEYNKLSDKNNSPIQLISQLKGYFYVNPLLALSLAITLFSFAGIPPLIGFFAKQMVLSAALDSGYIFLTFIGIFTSVISAVYYLGIIKTIFFDKADHEISPIFKKITLYGSIVRKNCACFLSEKTTQENKISRVSFNNNNIVLSGSLTLTISVLTLVILLFMLAPQEWLSLANIQALLLFNP